MVSLSKEYLADHQRDKKYLYAREQGGNIVFDVEINKPILLAENMGQDQEKIGDKKKT